MKLYKITMHPISSFATSLKGDTLFGQMCWAVFYQLGKEKLSLLLENYREDKPFLIVSDAFATGYFPKPKMPSHFLNEKSEDKKINRKKLWLTPNALIEGKYNQAKDDKTVHNSEKKGMRMHNALNYKTFHTGGEGFDPYGVESMVLSPKDIYILLDEDQLSFEEFKKVFKLFSEMGYGKKSSIGQGRFVYDENKIEEIQIVHTSNTFMSLSPFVPSGLEIKNIYYEPFTRFGKFGGDRVSKNPFKKPLLLADTASVIVLNEIKNVQYIGTNITGLTDLPEYQDTVHQGYSIVLPLKELSHD